MAGIVKIDFRITGIEGARAAIRSLTEEANRAATNEARMRASKLRETERLALEVARTQEKAAKQAAQAEVRAAKEAANEATRIKKDAARQVENAERDAARNRVRQEREAARESSRIAREQERTIAASRASFSSSIMRAGSGAAGNAKSMAGIAGKVTGLSNFDITGSNLMQGVIDRDLLARQISNQAYKAGAAGPAGQRQSVASIQKHAADVGQATALGSGDVLSGVNKFVSLTGDLQSAQGVAKEMAKLSQATGSKFEDMMGAAAQVSAALDASFGSDTQGKLETTAQIMKQIAGQGKEGAVEIKDFAKEMAKVAAASGGFSGKPEEVFAQLGAIVQTSRGGKGGSATSTQAAMAAFAFERDLAKESNLKTFEKAGVNIWADKGHKQKLTPEEIMINILKAANSDQAKMAKLMKNSMSKRAIQGFSAEYSAAEEKARKEKGKDYKAGVAGEAAVRAAFDKMKNAKMGDQEIEDSFKNVLDGPAAKAQLFQNNMERIAEATASKLLPALEKVGPHLLKGAEKVSSIIQFAAENPIKAAAIGLAASVAKAGIDEVLRAGAERMVARMAAAAIPGPGAGVGAGGALAKGLGVVGAAAAGYGVGTLIAGQIDKGINQEDRTARGKNFEALNAAAALMPARDKDGKALHGQITSQQVEYAKTKLAELEAEEAARKNSVRNKFSGAVNSVFGTGLISGAVDGLTGAAAEKGREADNQSTIKFLKDAISNVKLADGSTVNIGNADAITSGINKAIGSRDPTGQPIAGGT